MRVAPEMTKRSIAAVALCIGAGCSTAAPGAPAIESDAGGSVDSPWEGGAGGGGSASGGGTGDGASGGGAGVSASGGGAGVSASGGGAADVSSGGAIMASGTWADGQRLSGNIVIPSGNTVTVAPGAAIAIEAGTTVTVAGTLAGSSASPTHAKIAGPAWTGIVVAPGGVLSLDGVDIAGASTALDVQRGAKAEYDDGNIDGAAMPFDVEAGGALTTRSSTVTRTQGSSQIAGAFTASHLDYDAGYNSGIITMDPAATLSVEDSTLHGSGPSGDFLVSQGGAATFHVAYTDISNVHCAFHFDTITSFDISYTSVHQDAYGFMLYGSGGAGPRTVKYSNIDNSPGLAYDTAGQNGPIVFDHCYVTGNAYPGDAVTTASPQTKPVQGTGPRP
jgi:hypothetical protein